MYFSIFCMSVPQSDFTKTKHFLQSHSGILFLFCILEFCIIRHAWTAKFSAFCHLHVKNCSYVALDTKVEQHRVPSPKWVRTERLKSPPWEIAEFVTSYHSRSPIWSLESCNSGAPAIKKRCTEIAFGFFFEQGFLGVVADMNNMWLCCGGVCSKSSG